MKNTITKIDQLETVLSKKKKYVFDFGFKELSEQENKIWIDKINKNYAACGCNTGKIFTGISIILILFYTFFVQTVPVEKLTYQFYIFSLIFIVILSLIGKLLGKIIAHKKLKEDVLELKSLLLKNAIK